MPDKFGTTLLGILDTGDKQLLSFLFVHWILLEFLEKHQYKWLDSPKDASVGGGKDKKWDQQKNLIF